MKNYSLMEILVNLLALCILLQSLCLWIWWMLWRQLLHLHFKVVNKLVFLLIFSTQTMDYFTEQNGSYSVGLLSNWWKSTYEQVIIVLLHNILFLFRVLAKIFFAFIIRCFVYWCCHVSNLHLSFWIKLLISFNFRVDLPGVGDMNPVRNRIASTYELKAK